MDGRIRFKVCTNCAIGRNYRKFICNLVEENFITISTCKCQDIVTSFRFNKTLSTLKIFVLRTISEFCTMLIKMVCKF